MKINELHNNLKQNNVSNVYIIQGHDFHLVNLAVKEFSNNLPGLLLPELNITFYKENFDFENFIASMNTLPFASERRLIFVYFSSFSDDVLPLLISGFSEPPEFSVVVFIDDMIFAENSENDKKKKNDKKKLLLNFVKKLSFAIKIDCSSPDLTSTSDYLIRTAARFNLKISRQNIKYFLEYVNSDTETAVHEFNKLLTVCRIEIKQEDIEKYCIKNEEYKVFLLHGFLSSGKYDQAKSLLDDIFEDNPNPVWLFTMLANNFSKMLAAKLCKEGGYSKSQIISVLLEKYDVRNDRQATVIIQQAELYSPDAIRNSIIALSDADYKSKHGEFNLNPDLFGFLIKIYENKKELH